LNALKELEEMDDKDDDNLEPRGRSATGGNSLFDELRRRLSPGHAMLDSSSGIGGSSADKQRSSSRLSGFNLSVTKQDKSFDELPNGEEEEENENSILSATKVYSPFFI
jgi:hypothetical protein